MCLGCGPPALSLPARAGSCCLASGEVRAKGRPAGNHQPRSPLLQCTGLGGFGRETTGVSTTGNRGVSPRPGLRGPGGAPGRACWGAQSRSRLTGRHVAAPVKASNPCWSCCPHQDAGCVLVCLATCALKVVVLPSIPSPCRPDAHTQAHTRIRCIGLLKLGMSDARASGGGVPRQALARVCLRVLPSVASDPGPGVVPYVTPRARHTHTPTPAPIQHNLSAGFAQARPPPPTARRRRASSAAAAHDAVDARRRRGAGCCCLHARAERGWGGGVVGVGWPRTSFGVPPRIGPIATCPLRHRGGCVMRASAVA